MKSPVKSGGEHRVCQLSNIPQLDRSTASYARIRGNREWGVHLPAFEDRGMATSCNCRDVELEGVAGLGDNCKGDQSPTNGLSDIDDLHLVGFVMNSDDQRNQRFDVTNLERKLRVEGYRGGVKIMLPFAFKGLIGYHRQSGTVPSVLYRY